MTDWLGPGDCLPPDDRGLAYGDGLFETLAVRDGRACLWPAHRGRLLRGCAALGLPEPGNALDARVAEAAAALGDGVLKLVLTRGSGGRGYRPPEPPEPRCLLLPHPRPSWPQHHETAGVALALCRTRLGHQPRLAGLKHLNRLEQVLARAELDAETPEGVMLDREGRLVEGTMSNLFLRLDGRWVTPALDRCGVAGVVRGWLLEHGMPGAGSVRVRDDLTLVELFAAEAVLVTNSVIGAWAVHRVAGVEFEPPLELARRIREKVLDSCDG